MRRGLAGLAAVLTLVLGLLVLFGPYERVEMRTAFDLRQLSDGVDAYLAEQEARFPDIRPDQEKRVIWRELEEVPTDLSLVYIHGFSASSQEIRPVPDRLAEALKANLFYARLRGHGRDGAAMAGAEAGDWVADVAEALAVGRKLGRRVVVIASSTGASVLTTVAAEPGTMENVEGVVLVSPNFGLRAPGAKFLTWPAARYWLPLFGGKTQSFQPQTPEHARFWTTEYPSLALFPMAAVVRAANGVDHGAITVPALFYYSDDDTIVDPARTDAVVAQWGGPTTRARPYLGTGVDPSAHVIAGDALSPTNTEAAVEVMLDWIKGLE